MVPGVSLRQAYDATAAILRSHRIAPDTYDVVNQVERLRSYWAPEQSTRVVLLAESHVRTSRSDFKVILETNMLRRFDLEGYPSHFVRFVYCLGAGERELLPSKFNGTNRSKWQFWRLLWACEKNPDQVRFDLTKRANPDFEVRLRKKIELLRRLQNRGIWLVDASVIGINGLDPELKAEATKKSWDMYVGPHIQSLRPKPKLMIVIGKAVAAATFHTNSNDGEWSGIHYEVVNQPQGDRTTGGIARTLRRIFTSCSEHCPNPLTEQQ